MQMNWPDFAAAAPDVNKGLLIANAAIKQSSLEPRLSELVKLRVSQVNGCAFCIEMHANILQKQGVDNSLITLLPAWREVDIYTERERCALAYAEQLTIPNNVLKIESTEVDSLFSSDETIHLTAVIAIINAWNRISRAFRFTPGQAS